MTKTVKPPRMTGPTLKVLSMLLDERPTPLCGADFINAKGLFSGTLYPILERLEKAGWLKSHWEAIDPSKEGRPRKKLYEFTGVGERNAIRELNSIAVGQKGLATQASTLLAKVRLKPDGGGQLC